MGPIRACKSFNVTATSALTRISFGSRNDQTYVLPPVNKAGGTLFTR
jgi:hypothetical protein